MALGAAVAAAFVGACALDESGTTTDGGGPDVTPVEAGGPDADADAAEDVTYDVPDLGVGETESGLPCTCVSTAPQGYEYVEYVPNQRPPCSAGYDASADWLENVQATPASCTCTCGSTPTAPPVCTCGTDPVTFGVKSGHGNCTDYTGEALAASAAPGCDLAPQTITATGNGVDDILALPPAACTAKGGTCPAGQPKQQVAPYTVDQGRSCTVAASLGSCSGGTCVPTQGSGYKLCVTDFKTVSNTCPLSSFPVPHLVGGSVSDSRACGGNCTCGIVDAGTCGTPQIDLWKVSANCSGPPDLTIAADGTCQAINQGNVLAVTSSRYSTTDTTSACGYNGNYNATGGAVLANRFTICCQP